MNRLAHNVRVLERYRKDPISRDELPNNSNRYNQDYHQHF